MDPNEKQFTAATANSAAGSNPVTLRAWHRRNGLFPEMGGRQWNRFSVLDICIIRAVVIMTEHGIGANEAVRAVQFPLGIKLELLALLKGSKRGGVVGICRGETGSPDEEVFEWETRRLVKRGDTSPARLTTKVFGSKREAIPALMSEVHSGVLTLIDLRSIVRHVTDHLNKSIGDA